MPDSSEPLLPPPPSAPVVAPPVQTVPPPAPIVVPPHPPAVAPAPPAPPPVAPLAPPPQEQKKGNALSLIVFGVLGVVAVILALGAVYIFLFLK